MIHNLEIRTREVQSVGDALREIFGNSGNGDCPGEAELLAQVESIYAGDEFYQDMVNLAKNNPRLLHRLLLMRERAPEEKDLLQPLAREKEDRLLKDAGFNDREIEVFDVRMLRQTYAPEQFKALQEYLRTIDSHRRDGRGALFIGNNGNGKTNSMSLCFRVLMREHWDGMNGQVRIGMRKESAEALMEEILADQFDRAMWYCRISVLGIDDILFYSDHRHNALRWLVNERTSRKGLLTFATTRLMPEELQQYRDIYSRMQLGMIFNTIGQDARNVFHGQMSIAGGKQ